LQGIEAREVQRLRSTPFVLPDSDDTCAELLSLLAHPNVGSKRRVWRQYDHTIQTNTVVPPGADAAVLRLKGRQDAVALTIDGDGRRCYLEPYSGGALAVLEAARNLACVGARPLCVTDCLNFGNPERPEVYYQLEQAISGMADACSALSIPVVSGNVSLYNESQWGAIYPTPVVGMAGHIFDVHRVCTLGFKREGDLIILIGADDVSLAGSVYAQLRGLSPCGQPAALDIDLECRVQIVCRKAIEAGMLRSAHDCSEGGLAVALVESALAGNRGAEIEFSVPEGRRSQAMFGEGPSRIVVSMAYTDLPRLATLADAYDVPWRRLGRVDGSTLIWRGLFTLELSTLSHAYESALDTIFGEEGA
jgi:phosphoribosylformylglycinamidine synthase